jgi:site-specific recombinase XerD
MIWTVPYYPGQGQPSETNVHPIEPDVLNEGAVLKSALAARPSTTTDFVFVSQKGGRLRRSQIFRIFQSAAKLAKLPETKQHYHCVKHSLAFQMLKNGARLNEVQKYLGWSSLATAQHYLGVSDETASQAARCALVNV